MNRWVRTGGYDKTKAVTVLKNTPNTETLINSEKVTASTNLLITHIGNQLDQIAGWNDQGGCKFTLKINGVPHEIMTDETNQLGTANQPRKLGLPVLVRGGSLIELTGKNPSTTTDYQMLITLQGEYGYERM